MRDLFPKNETKDMKLLIFIIFLSSVSGDTKLIKAFSQNDSVCWNDTKSILDIWQLTNPFRINITCDLIKFLVPNSICANQVAFMCKRPEIFIQSEYKV